MYLTSCVAIVLDIDNRSVITHGGCKINWYSAKLRHVNRGKNCDDFPPDHYLDVSAVSGRGVLVPLEVFDKTTRQKCIAISTSRTTPIKKLGADSRTRGTC